MNITAMLVFWDEPADVLYKWAKNAGTLADHIVAADGPFALYPHTTVRSSPVALTALRDGAGDGGSTLDLLSGRRWAGQVEKRDAVIKRTRPDWVFWMDADERISVCDVDEVRGFLERTNADSIITHRYTPPNKDARWKPDSTEDEAEGKTSQYQRIYRHLPQMGVQMAHWGYTAVKDGVPVCYWMNVPGHNTVLQKTIPAEHLLFEHFQTWRSDGYRKRQLEYRAATREQVVENSGFES